jgi:transglutaminase superfamily protein
MLSLLKPLPARITRPLSSLVLVLWVGVMGVLVNRSYLQASGNLATDLARYGSTAQWRGVYYRGEKLGFTVSQTVPVANDPDAAFELQEDAELQMTLLGATIPAKIRTTARVNRAFELRSFEFSLDPGTGPTKVRGHVQGLKLLIAITTSSGTRTEVRQLTEPPMLALNLSRRLADAGLRPGARYRWSVFDPATLRNAPIVVDIGSREIVRAASAPIPAFRVDMEFVGLRTTSWITDTGEVIREESPMGFITVRETAERARTLAMPGQIRLDLLRAAAVVPEMRQPIDETRDVRRIRMRIEGADLSSPDLQGAGQSVKGDIVEITDTQNLSAGPADPLAKQFLDPELLIESDDPEIRAEAEAAVRNLTGGRARAEALTRYVNQLLEKKPTVSLPSAREVLRTKIGDCNEHTALFVAMARSIGIPSRIAVGLTFVRGAFYYHAWPEVYIEEHSGRLRQGYGEPRQSEATAGAGRNSSIGRGVWLPVDPTLNQFPADATHIRLARGGLDKQAAIVPLIGRLKITVLDAELAPGTTPILVGRASPVGAAPMLAPPQRRESRWCLPCFLAGHEKPRAARGEGPPQASGAERGGGPPRLSKAAANAKPQRGEGTGGGGGAPPQTKQ